VVFPVSNHLALLVEEWIIVKLSGTPLEYHWVASFASERGGGRHHLGTITGTSTMQDVFVLISGHYPLQVV